MTRYIKSKGEEIANIQRYFEQHPMRFKDVAVVGSGEFGVCIKLMEKRKKPEKSGRFVIQRASAVEQQAALLSDIQRLKVTSRNHP